MSNHELSIETFNALQSANFHITQSLPSKLDGISFQKFGVLKAICQNENATPKLILQELKLSGPLLTHILNYLEKNGFIQRKQVKEDRRSFSLKSTTKGKKSFQKHKDDYDQAIANALSTFSQNELKQVKQLLSKL